MIKEKEIIFKNEKIEEYIGKHLQFMKSKNQYQAQSKMSAEENAANILAGYWFSLLNDAVMNHLPVEDWIDFSYETIDKLPIALAALYKLQSESYSQKENAEIIAKTVAAVCYALAMNEHNCEFKVSTRRTKLTPPNAVLPPLWADAYSIETGIKESVDFLPPALKTINSPFEMEKGIFISMRPIIRAYQRATGVNLEDYHIADIAING